MYVGAALDHDSIPDIAHFNKYLTVYFKQDERFGQPKAFAIFQLLIKEVFSSTKCTSLVQLYQLCASDQLEN